MSVWDTKVTYVEVETGDNALVVSGKICDTADPTFKEPSLETCAGNIAEALGFSYEKLELEIPEDELEDWTWEKLLSDNKIIRPVTSSEPE